MDPLRAAARSADTAVVPVTHEARATALVVRDGGSRDAARRMSVRQ
jgi:hypothetical protein